MQETDVQALVRERAGLRVEPEMAAYVRRRLEQAPGQPIAIIAGDARTGIALRAELSAAELRAILEERAAPDHA